MEVDEPFEFERGFGMRTLMWGRQLVGVHCAKAVRGGIDEYGGQSPARLLCRGLPDLALGFAIYFPSLLGCPLRK